MTDYEKIGFKCGLEIHQQIEGKKLFCRCNTSNLRDKKADIAFKRRLRAVVGETGEIDAAAAHEQAKSKYYIYEGSSKDCCLVDMDEEPPHNMNEAALQVCLEVAHHLNMKIVDEIQVMRKTVVDGSNVSGFQRTALIGSNGFIETSLGKVIVDSLCLEEEACQKIEDGKDFVRYRLDRLGIPLLEIATAPDIKSPEHAKECAEKLGMILRSTGKVKRGLGTIRQDVNVSIKGGARTEIKGFQDLKSIPKIVENETERQIKSVKKGEKLVNEVRKAESNYSTTFLRPMPGAARMYPETDVLPVRAEIGEYEGGELIDDKAARFVKKFGLGKDLALVVAKSALADDFEKYVSKFKKVKPAFIAETMVSAPREIRRKENIDVNLSSSQFEELFGLLDSGKISKDSVIDAMIAMSKGKFDVKNYETVSAQDLEKEIKKIVDKNKDAPMGAIMGQVMSKFKGKADGKLVSEIVKKMVK